jgi:hypothetical protein
MSDEAGRAVIRKWARMKEKAEQAHEEATASLSKYIKSALKDKKTFVNLLKDERSAKGNPERRDQNASGFRKMDELITGYEPDPWENREDYTERIRRAQDPNFEDDDDF